MNAGAARLVSRLRGVVFDLDGTLIDTVPDLARATNAVLAHRGVPPLTEQQVAALVGGGIEALVVRALTLAIGAPPRTVELASALARFREFYRDHLFERSRVYAEVVPALEALRNRGLALCCVTNKAAVFAEPLLEAAGIDRFLDGIFCPASSDERKPHPTLLLRACGRLHSEPARVLCVGDSWADVGAARAAGCPVAAVDYGYHHGQLCGEHAPDWLISRLTDVVSLPMTFS